MQFEAFVQLILPFCAHDTSGTYILHQYYTTNNVPANILISTSFIKVCCNYADLRIQDCICAMSRVSTYTAAGQISTIHRL